MAGVAGAHREAEASEGGGWRGRWGAWGRIVAHDITLRNHSPDIRPQRRVKAPVRAQRPPYLIGAANTAGTPTPLSEPPSSISNAGSDADFSSGATKEIKLFDNDRANF